MDTEKNAAWLHERYEDFKEALSGRVRAAIIKEVMEAGYEQDGDTMLDDWYTERTMFMKDHGATLGDILSDDDGEYFLDELENGTAGDDGYNVETIAVRIPEYLNPDMWPIK